MQEIVSVMSGGTAIDVGLLKVHFDNIAQTSRTEVNFYTFCRLNFAL